VPILAITTADPAGVLRLVVAEAQNGTNVPVMAWDCIHGIQPCNEAGQELASTLNGNQEPAIATGNPVEALRALEQLGGRQDTPVAVMFGLADVLVDPQAGIAARQAVWNLRDPLAAAGATLILVVPTGWSNPFPNDIAVAEDALPNKEELVTTAVRLANEAQIQELDPVQKAACADALIGLSGFAAEQALALSIQNRKTGINLPSLWTRKRQQIAETAGLSVYAGQETFKDLGGVDQAKGFFKRLLVGKRKPGAVVFCDEIEKALAGSSTSGGDSSGVSQSVLGYLLTYMQDQNATGALFIGPPGAAKSAMAKAIGNEGGIPTITLDLGGIKGSLVGESERRMREALAVITAVSDGRPLFIATCNSIGVLPPELRRRFTLGTIYFDLPTAEERDAIWPIYLKKYNLIKQKLPEADRWTGAEIKQCCDLADRLGCALLEAAKYIVPVAIAARESIERLQNEASGRYLNAGAPGLYTKAIAGAKARKLGVN